MPEPAKFRPDTAHAEHPVLSDRKALTTRMIAAYVRVQAEQSNPLDQGFDDLQLTVDARTRSSSHKVHTTTLSTFLNDLVADLRKLNATEAARLMIERFAAEAASIDCERCARNSGSGLPCNHSLDDAQNMEYGGQCWSLLTELFTHLVGLAEEVYGPLLREHEIRDLHLRLCTLRTTDAELGARTKFPPENGSGRRATIELRLPVEEFNDTHLTRLPYILFHEICVHGPEAWLGGSRHLDGPERTTELCAFREGFVDAAAAWLLCHRLVNAPERLGRHAALADKYEAATRAAHHERASVGPAGLRAGGERDRTLRGIKNSREQGQSLFARLLGLDGDGLKATGGAVARLAFALNLLPLTDKERIRLVQSMSAVAKPFAVLRRRAWFECLLEATSAHDLGRLRAEVEPYVIESDFGD